MLSCLLVEWVTCCTSVSAITCYHMVDKDVKGGELILFWQVTRYLFEFKAMVEGAKHCTQAMSDATRHDETGSEEGNA